jgi:hypothetical protein
MQTITSTRSLLKKLKRKIFANEFHEFARNKEKVKEEDVCPQIPTRRDLYK